MKSIFFLFACLVNVTFAVAQPVPQKLAAAVKQLEADAQMKYAIFSMYVVDAKTGKPVYEHNSNVGLAPASAQKLFTAAAAFELLGQTYRYKTEIGYRNGLKQSPDYGEFVVRSFGDPTFGSFRFASTRPQKILGNIVDSIRRKGPGTLSMIFNLAGNDFGLNPIPRGWIWEDIGNYYGAGAHPLNWLENQYDIVLRSGKNIGDSVKLVKTQPNYNRDFIVNIKSAARGTGDNAYAFLPVERGIPLLEGTIPVNEDAFSISASIPDPFSFFINQLTTAIRDSNLATTDLYSSRPFKVDAAALTYTRLFTYYSPPLDSINYWFLRRSVNLYGEALVKTMAYEKEGYGSTEKGVELVRNFWQQQGIDKAAIHIIDGSGLSPQNRVTTRSLVQVLQYAKNRPWYISFYNCLPEYNGMKLKSGSVGGARAFAGYHTAKDGKEYACAIIVNNYDGSAGDAVKKMYRVLDVLK